MPSSTETRTRNNCINYELVRECVYARVRAYYYYFIVGILGAPHAVPVSTFELERHSHVKMYIYFGYMYF